MLLTCRPAIASDFSRIGLTKEVMEGTPIDGLCWAVQSYDEVMAIFGHVPFWEGTTTVWMTVKREANIPALSFTKMCIRMMKLELSGYARIQAFVDSKSAVNNKFIRALGFTMESTMVNGNPNGGHYNVYRRLP